MRWNFKRELARKFVHLLSIFILFIYFLVSDIFSSKIALIILVLILIIFLEFEYFRIEIGKKIPVINWISEYLRRRKEKNKLGGDVFFLIGSILVLSIFDIRVAMAAILMTTFGDLSAALIGSRFGKHPVSFLKNRAWEGILAELFVDVLIGIFVFAGMFEFNFAYAISWQVLAISLIMSLTATLVETLIYKLDDNLFIPIFAGFNGQILLMILQIYNYI